VKKLKNHKVASMNEKSSLLKLKEIFPKKPFSLIEDIIGLAFKSFGLALVLAIAWAFFQPPHLSYQGLPWEVISGPDKIFYPGDVVPVIVKRCNNTNHQVIYTVTRSIQRINGNLIEDAYVFPDTRVSLEPGCKSAVSNIHILPKDIKDGTYQISGTATVNAPINNVELQFYSVPFKVKEHRPE
jgi:hypothetical protein